MHFTKIPSKVIASALSIVLAMTICAIVPTSADAATPAKTSISSLSKAAKSFTVKWKKNSKADGYQIRYSANSNMKTGVKTINASKATVSKKVSSKVKPATTYYVQIRVAYKANGKKRYTGWSSKKAVTTLVGSGNSAFDKKIESVLSKKVKKTGASGLKKAFNYVADLRQGSTTTASRSGAWTKWSVKYANDMIGRGQGNCYQAAALMAWLAKGLGYDAKAVCGTYTGGSGKVNPHGWAEVKIGSKWYILDANNQNTANNAGLSLSYFKVSKSSDTGKKYSAE